MAEFTIAELLEATGGQLVGKLHSGSCGISIDTRTIARGETYVAIVGKRLDGHEFVAEAFEKGAYGAVVSRPVATPDHRWLIVVPDTTRALGDIAAFHRKRFDPMVVGVTGSNGKSTTKEILAAILGRRYRVLKPKSSFNNDIGVPLTVLGLTRETEAAVIEMEMNVFGGIQRLCEIAQPRIGIVTNIADTHLEFLGDRQGVAREKSELIAYIDGAGFAVLNADDPLVMDIGRRYPTRETITFGMTSDADIYATRVEEQGEKGTWFRLNGRIPVVLGLAGTHNVYNALAAIAASGAAGIHLHEAIAGLAEFQPLPLRLQIEHYHDLTLIVDCYNANPQSMAAAFEVLEKTGTGRKIAVLGDMFELGASAEEAHAAVGKRAGQVSEIVIASGQFADRVVAGAKQAGRKSGQAVAARDFDELVEKLVDFAQPRDTILVKGSRANHLEEIVQELKKRIAGKSGRRKVRSSV